MQALFAFVAGAAVVMMANAVTLDSLKQGSEFTKCIKKTDWDTKVPKDELSEFKDKDAGGCCPDGYIPGFKTYKSTGSATSPTYKVYGMISCGWKDDGSIEWSSSSSNGVKTCKTGKCYVIKQDFTCAGAGSKKMGVNGCCASKTYKSGSAYPYCTAGTWGVNGANACYTYVTDKTGWPLQGTLDAKDDIDKADSKMAVDKVHMYKMCGSSGSGSGPAPAASSAVQATIGVMGLMAATVLFGF